MLKKIRKTKVEKEEVIADFIFMLVSFVIVEIALYIFDIHWNFYPSGQLFLPEKYIFQDSSIFLWGGLIGAIGGLFIIKLFLLGVKEEETVWKKDKH